MDDTELQAKLDKVNRQIDEMEAFKCYARGATTAFIRRRLSQLKRKRSALLTICLLNAKFERNLEEVF